MKILLALILAQAPSDRFPRVLCSGVNLGRASQVNYTGAGVSSCTGGPSGVTLALAGGVPTAPSGVSGDVQVNDGAGGLGVYTGTSCAYAVKSLDSGGVAACTVAPVDLSGEPIITKIASVNLTNEFALGSLPTALLVNTVTTGVPTAYAGASCTNQFLRALSASGAPTCASIGIADLSATGAPSATTFLRGDNTWATPAGGTLHYQTVQENGTTKTQRSKLNLVNGTASTVVCTDDAVNDATNCVVDTAPPPLSYDTVQDEVTVLNQQPTLRFIGAGVTCADDSLNSTTNCTIPGGGAPTTSKYVLQTADAALPNAQAMGALATGIVKNTTTTGVQSIAVADTDYASVATTCKTLGTATAAATTVGPVIWTGTYSNIYVNYEITGYNGGTPIGRVLVGSAAISTTALTNGTSAYEGVAGTLTSTLSKPGAPLAVTASAIARGGTVHFFGRSGALKNYEIEGANGTPSVSVARTGYRGWGSFSDLGTNLPLQRAQLTVYDTLTATAASAQAFTTGTTITVIGCP